MDIKEEKKAIKNIKAHLMDEWELTEEQKDEFDNLVFRVLAVGKEEAKAQAVPEGFVLVKKDHLSEAVEKIELMFEEDSTLALGELLPIQQGIKAMIEAQEQKG